MILYFSTSKKNSTLSEISQEYTISEYIIYPCSVNVPNVLILFKFTSR